MKILKNKEEIIKCGCNSSWPNAKWVDTHFEVTDNRSPDNGKSIVFAVGHCPTCGLFKWRILE